MDKLPQRDDLIYKEIEEFQDYELTNCIAYEMMIRNKDAAEELKNSYDKKYWDDFDNEEHTNIYNQYKKELDNLFKIIENKFNDLRK